jgi:hypothetical protein
MEDIYMALKMKVDEPKKKLTAVLGKDGFGSQNIRIVSSKNTNMGILICIHF